MKAISIYILVSLVVISSYDLIAITAQPGILQFQQSDGTMISLYRKGDERIHWAETMDGFTVLSSATGSYCYAVMDARGDLVISTVTAHNEKERSQAELQFTSLLQKHLFFSGNQVRQMKSILNQSNTRATLSGGFPTTGTRKMLMILANFNNTTTTFTQNNFNNYMNQVNYNSTGSFRDYYLEVSYGILTVNTTVTIWVTLPNTHDYYGPDTKWGEFAHDAVIAADNQAGVNYSDFDNNGDGWVDGVAIIHQGRGQEESGSTLDIWSHSWDLTSAGFPTVLDGVHVDAYTTMPEKGNATSMGTVGVMCHEFGHNLGAPDFYDTDYNNTGNGEYDGTGYWDVMAAGSWNGVSAAGDKPAHHNAWSKAFYGWMNPVIISSGTYTLPNAAAFPGAFQYNTTTSNEYFLCENRQKTGFDAGIPGHGLIIYHVDGSYIISHYNNNDININSHQGMFPMAANSSISNGIMLSSASTINTGGCPFPGTSSKTSFTDNTTPNAKSWAGNASGFPITNISENMTEKTVSFCITTCNASNDPLSFSAVPYNSSRIDLAWTKNSSSNPVLIAFNTAFSFGTPAGGSAYSAGDPLPGGGTVIYSGPDNSFIHQMLLSGTTYYYKTWSVLPGNQYSQGITTQAMTTCGTVVLPLAETFENSFTDPDCWTEENISPSWQFVTGGYGGHPATAHGGNLNAFLFDNTTASNRNKLISPVMDLSGHSSVTLTFYHTQAKWTNDQDELRVYYRASLTGAWTLISAYTGSITTWHLETVVLPAAALTATCQIAFEGDAKYGYGVCLDDIALHAAGNWIGGTAGTPTLWNVATNWDDGTVPTSLVNVYVPLRGNSPVVNVSSSCNDFILGTGANIRISNGTQLNVNGNMLLK